jgi:hypothetical protein
MSYRPARANAASARFAFAAARRASVLLVTIASLSPLAACTRDDKVLPTDGSGPVTETPAPNAKRWSDPANWPDQKVPGVGVDVVIAKGTDLLLDVSPPALSSLKIEGSLTAQDRDLELTAGSIHVFGSLIVGSERTPFMHKMVFTLTGDDPGIDAPSKTIAVYGSGLLELHGESRTSWTRLGATATAGSTQLLLDAPTDWRAGDRVVVASTSFEPSEAEAVRIASVSGASVTLGEPLHFTHWGALQTIGGGTVDERAEVGLLSRNVVVRGDERSDVSGFGGHIMMMGGTTRIEGIELTRVGQRGKLARASTRAPTASGTRSAAASPCMARTMSRSRTMCATITLGTASFSKTASRPVTPSAETSASSRAFRQRASVSSRAMRRRRRSG